MSQEIERSAQLIERLLGNPDLRRRFRSDPATVLVEAGLSELASGLGRGRQALMALELRESRSSLAGVMVAAAAEGVDFAQAAAHAAPSLAREARQAVAHLVDQPRPPHPPPAHVQSTTAPPGGPSSLRENLAPPAQTPPLQAPAPAPATATGAGMGTATPSLPAPPATTAGPASTPVAAAGHPAPAEGAQMSFDAPGGAPHHAVHPEAHPREHHPGGQVGARLVTEASVGGIGYPGDDASPQALAAWMGARAQQAGLPPELPLMAALTESGLHNLSYGDRDSLGFFQMRTSIWNSGAYAGYPDHPELQIQWFIDHALAARAQDPALAQSPDSWGEWIANVEQPAAQYRYRYQLQLGAAQELLRGTHLGTGTAAGTGSALDVAAGSAAAPPPPPPPPGEGALKAAMSLLTSAHSTGPRPTDSSSLVSLVYGRQGLQLPAGAPEQFDLGLPVTRGALHPGDVIFLAGPNGQIAQEGIYAGGGRFVTISPQDGSLELASLADPHHAQAFVGARRFTLPALEDPGRYARPLPTIAPAGPADRLS
jgi:cell wall-associated NlpC family hydrolase